MALNSRSGLTISTMPIFECDCCEFMVVEVRAVRLNFYVFFIHINPCIDDSVSDRLLEFIAKIQYEYRKSA